MLNADWLACLLGETPGSTPEQLWWVSELGKKAPLSCGDRDGRPRCSLLRGEFSGLVACRYFAGRGASRWAPWASLGDGQIGWERHQLRCFHPQQVRQPHQRAQRQVLPSCLDPPQVAHRHVPALRHLFLGQPGLAAQFGHSPTYPSHHRTGLFHRGEPSRRGGSSTGLYKFLFSLTDMPPCFPLRGMFRRSGPSPALSGAPG